MTPAELREAVATAMPEVLGPTHRLILADAALAVVREALRKPTPVQINRGLEGADINWRAACEDKGLSDNEVRRIWRAMLAASPLGGGHD